MSRRVSEIIFAFGTTGSQWDIRDIYIYIDPSDAHFCLDFDLLLTSGESMDELKLY